MCLKIATDRTDKYFLDLTPQIFNANRRILLENFRKTILLNRHKVGRKDR